MTPSASPRAVCNEIVAVEVTSGCTLEQRGRAFDCVYPSNTLPSHGGVSYLEDLE